MRKSEETEKAPAHQRINLRDIKSGHVMSITHYVKVTEVRDSGRRLTVESIDGGPGKFDIIGGDLVQDMTSADLFASEEKVTKTAAAEMLVTAYNTPFTVCFETQSGAERVLRGRLVKPENLLGRSQVIDLEVPAGESSFRLVDHRTIKYLILNNVKYTVK